MIALFAIIVSAFSFIKPLEKTTKVRVTTVPSINIKTLDGNTINSKDIIRNGEPTLLVFWATCCAPCKKELTAISKVYDSWQKKTGVNIVAVSVDLPQYANGVKPFVESNNSKYDVYLDVDRNLMHAMNANNTPHSYLLNTKGDIVWEKQGFFDGDEVTIYNEISKASRK